MKIRPIGKNVLFKPRRDVLPGIAEIAFADAQPEVGDVLEVGADCKEISKGDVLIFKGYGVVVPEIGGEKFFFIKEDDDITLGIISNE